MTVSGFLREFSYPLREPALLLAAAVTTLALALAGMAGLFGLPLTVLVVVGYLKYLTDVLVARAMNDPAPVPSMDTYNLAIQHWKLGGALLGLGLLALAILVERRFGVSAAVAVAAASAAWYPAALAALALTNSPLAMFDFPRQFLLVRELGRDYGLILLGQVLAALALGFAGFLQLPQLVTSFLYNAATILLYSMTGAVLYRHRDAIGHAREDIETREQRQLDKARMAYVDRAYAFFSRGNSTGGINELRRLFSDEGESLELSSWLYDVLSQWEIAGPQLAFAPHYIGQLLGAGADAEAIRVFSSCRRRDAAFVPNPASIAGLLRAARRFELREEVDALSGLSSAAQEREISTT